MHNFIHCLYFHVVIMHKDINAKDLLGCALFTLWFTKLSSSSLFCVNEWIYYLFFIVVHDQ